MKYFEAKLVKSFGRDVDGAESVDDFRDKKPLFRRGECSTALPTKVAGSEPIGMGVRFSEVIRTSETLRVATTRERRLPRRESVARLGAAMHPHVLRIEFECKA